MIEFKVGDKVTLSRKGVWSSPETKRAAKDGTVVTIEGIGDRSVSATIAGRYFPTLSKEHVIPAPAEPRDTRAETIAYLQGQLAKASADQLQAQKDEEAAFKRRVALGERRAELNAQIKLLDPTTPTFKVGDRARVNAHYSTFHGSEGKVIKVDGKTIEVTGLLRRDGTLSSGLYFEETELEAI